MIDLKTLQQQEQRYRIIAFTIPLVIIIVAYGTFSAGSNLSKEINQKRLTLGQKQQAAIESMQFNQFIQSNNLKLGLINNVIPNESMMIGVVQDFESIVTSFDPQATVKIASTTPTKIGEYLSIALVINYQGPLNQVSSLLTKLHDLPYMIQLLSVDSNQAGDTYSHQLTLRLYVQDPFNSP